MKIKRKVKVYPILILNIIITLKIVKNIMWLTKLWKKNLPIYQWETLWDKKLNQIKIKIIS